MGGPMRKAQPQQLDLVPGHVNLREFEDNCRLQGWKGGAEDTLPRQPCNTMHFPETHSWNGRIFHLFKCCSKAGGASCLGTVGYLALGVTQTCACALFGPDLAMPAKR